MRARLRTTSPVLAAALLASMLRRARTCSAASCASSVTSGHDHLITGWSNLGPPASRPGGLAFGGKAEKRPVRGSEANADAHSAAAGPSTCKKADYVLRFSPPYGQQTLAKKISLSAIFSFYSVCSAG